MSVTPTYYSPFGFLTTDIQAQFTLSQRLANEIMEIDKVIASLVGANADVGTINRLKTSRDSLVDIGKSLAQNARTTTANATVSASTSTVTFSSGSTILK